MPANNNATQEKVPTWLETAAEITQGDRRRAYGRPLMNFLRIAIDRNLNDAGRRLPGDYYTPLDVARDQVGMKKARDLNDFKDDNWVDTMGYAACVDDMDRQMKEMGFHGVKSFDGMNIQGMFELLCRLVQEHNASVGKPAGIDVAAFLRL